MPLALLEAAGVASRSGFKEGFQKLVPWLSIGISYEVFHQAPYLQEEIAYKLGIPPRESDPGTVGALPLAQLRQTPEGPTS
jgi:hypothetical protein